MPPYGSLSVLWERQAKSESPAREELLAKYASDYTSSADRMIDGFLDYAGREARTS